jgi:hypothetical protein
MPAMVGGAARERAQHNAPMRSVRPVWSYASANLPGAKALLTPTGMSGMSPRAVIRLPPDMPRAAARDGASHQRQLAPHS